MSDIQENLDPEQELNFDDPVDDTPAEEVEEIDEDEDNEVEEADNA